MNIAQVILHIYNIALSQACTINRAWCIFRICNADRQVVPGWGGFISEMYVCTKYVDVMLQMADMTDERRGNTHQDVHLR